MPVNKLFGGGVALTAQALDLRMQKQGLIQSNIANLETPGYVARDISFAQAMARAVEDQGNLTRTHSGHLNIDPLTAAASMEPTSQGRPVDLDEEMLKLSENQLMFQITARLLGKKFEGMQYAIDEGGK